MPNNYYNQSRATVKKQEPGFLSTKAWLSPIAKFTLIGTPVANSIGSAAKIIPATADHTFGTNDGFMRCYLLPHKHEGSMDSNGDNGAQNFVHKHKIFFPGDGPQLLQFLEIVKNEDLIFLAKEQDGGVVQIGTEAIPANFVKATFASGTTKDGVKGYECEIESPAKFWYEGDITEGTFS